MNDQKSVIGILVLANILFGLNFVANKAVLGNLSAIEWGCLRMLIGGLFILAYALTGKRKMPPIREKSFLVPFLWLGGVWIAFQTLQLVGISLTSATNASILFTLTPAFALLIITLRGLEVLNSKRILGFAIAFVGAICIRKVEDFQLTDKTIVGDLMAVCSSVLMATFLCYSKKFLQEFDFLWSIALMLLLGSTEVAAVGALTGTNFHAPDLNPTLIGWILFSATLGSALPFALNLWGIKRAPPSIVALLFYIQPIVGASFAWLWLGEPMSVRKLVSIATIIFGIVLVRKGTAAPPQASVEGRKAS